MIIYVFTPSENYIDISGGSLIWGNKFIVFLILVLLFFFGKIVKFSIFVIQKVKFSIFVMFGSNGTWGKNMSSPPRHEVQTTRKAMKSSITLMWFTILTRRSLGSYSHIAIAKKESWNMLYFTSDSNSLLSSKPKRWKMFIKISKQYMKFVINQNEKIIDKVAMLPAGKSKIAAVAMIC